MTVSAAPPFNEHTGNGVTTSFAYGFRIISSSHLLVYVAGVLVTSGYTVSGVGNNGGGTVDFSVAPANGAEVLLKRSVPRTRSVDYVDNGDFTAEDIDNDQDLQTMSIQDIGVDADRAIKFPLGDADNQDLPDATERAGKALTFDANGLPVVSELGVDNDPSLRTDLAAAGGAALVGFSLGGSVEANLKRAHTARTDGYTALAADHASINTFAASGTLNLTAAATLGNGWFTTVRAAVGATVTIDPAGGEMINGGATFTLYEGQECVVECDGSAFYANVSRFSRFFQSSDITPTASTDGDVAHGLGMTPKFTQAVLRCVTAQANWVAGDEVLPDSGGNETGGQTTGVTIGVNSTSLRYAIGQSGITLIDRTANARFTITAANWALVLRAWA